MERGETHINLSIVNLESMDILVILINLIWQLIT
jgi:hypothetical protein